MPRRRFASLVSPDRFRQDCERCQVYRTGAKALMRGQSFRKHQHRLLLSARADEDVPITLPKKHSTQVAIGRAVRRLRQLGLIDVSEKAERWDSPEVQAATGRQYVRVRSMRLTPFGQAVMDEFGGGIRRGQVRWTVEGVQRALDRAVAKHRHIKARRR